MATHPSLKDPMAKVWLLVVSAFLLAAVFYLVSSLVSTIGKNSQKGEIDTDTLIANNAAIVADAIKPIGEVATSDGAGAAPVAGAGGSRSGEEVYNAVCTACHTTGAAGAPKVDDKAAWESRVATGIDALMNSAINGKNAMPPRGGQNVSDDELKAAIGFMTAKAGFNLDLGAAPVAKEEATAEAKKDEVPADAKEVAPVKEEAPAAPAQEAAPTPPAQEEAPAAPAQEAAPTAPAQEAAPTPPAQEAVTPQEKQATGATAAAGTSAAVQGSGISGEKIYKSTCFACHDMGVAGAPKIGEKSLWEPRIATGKDALYNSALNGKTTPSGMMPPKGGNTSLSDDEVKAAVDYIISRVQ